VARTKKLARKIRPMAAPSSAQKSKNNAPRSKGGNKPATSRFNFFNLSSRSQSSYNRSLEVLKLMRRSQDLTFSKALREAGLGRRTAKKYLGDVLVREGGGKFRARKSDRKPARVNVFTEQGIDQVVVRGWKQRSRAGRHYAAVQRYARTGDKSGLKEFENLKLGKHVLITDTKVLDQILDTLAADDKFEIYSDPAEALG
jgi:hypothetical protein